MSTTEHAYLREKQSAGAMTPAESDRLAHLNKVEFRENSDRRKQYALEAAEEILSRDTVQGITAAANKHGVVFYDTGFGDWFADRYKVVGEHRRLKSDAATAWAEKVKHNTRF